VRGLQLSSTIAWFHGVVGGSLHRLFELDVRLSSGKDLTHLGSITLQEVFVQRISDLQPGDERVAETSSPQLETLISWL